MTCEELLAIEADPMSALTILPSELDAVNRHLKSCSVCLDRTTERMAVSVQEMSEELFAEAMQFALGRVAEMNLFQATDPEAPK